MQRNRRTMKRQRIEIRLAVSSDLGLVADNPFREEGFARRSDRALTYSRHFAECSQVVQVGIDHSAVGNRNAAAAIQPWVAVSIPAVNSIVAELKAGVEFAMPSTSFTLRQPIEFLSEPRARARWYIYQRDSVTPVVSEFVAFSKEFVFPFLLSYRSPGDVVRMYECQDSRIVQDRTHLMRVVASYLLLGEPRNAYDLLQRHFGRPMMRRVYAPVYRYVEQRLAEAEQRDAKS